MTDQPTPDTPRCGIARDTWDLGIRMRDYCNAPAGHSDSPMTYDHGPWTGVDPAPPRDGLGCPQGGREGAAAGAEPSEGLNGAQAGADGLDPYRQLLARLQEERARALRNAPRATLGEARLVNEGIASGLQIAAAWAITLFEGHEARIAYLAAEGSDGRTTPDNPVTSSDAADNPGLREQIAALFRHPPGAERLGDATPGEIADAVLAVRDTEVEQLRARIVTLEHVAAGNKRHVQLLIPDLEAAQAAIARMQHLADLIAAGAPWGRNLDDLAGRIRDAINPDGHDAGPSVAECRDADRRWPLEKAGE